MGQDDLLSHVVHLKTAGRILWVYKVIPGLYTRIVSSDVVLRSPYNYTSRCIYEWLSLSMYFYEWLWMGGVYSVNCCNWTNSCVLHLTTTLYSIDGVGCRVSSLCTTLLRSGPQLRSLEQISVYCSLPREVLIWRGVGTDGSLYSVKIVETKCILSSSTSSWSGNE